MKWISTYFQRQELENQLFLATLIVAIPYFISSIVFDLLSLDNYVLLTIDSSFFLLCIAMIFLHKKEKLRAILINIFCVFVLSGFVFFWISSGGMQGGGSYVFPVISVLIILITKGRYTIIFSILLVAIAVVVSLDILPVEGGGNYIGLLFDFILNLLMLVTILIFFKSKLDKEHRELAKKNASIQALNAELKLKSTELELYNRDVEIIGKNLEKVAELHHLNLKKENEKIIEYSFINAHLLRAPLANIIGLTDLIDQKSDQIKRLDSNAKNLDAVLHKISGVLHGRG